MGWPGHGLAAKIALAVVAAWLAAMAVVVHGAALSPEASGKMLAVFEPGTSDDEVFRTLVAAGGRPLRATWLPFVWAVAGEESGFAGKLKAKGALGAYGELPFAPALAGCFAYADAKMVEFFALRP